MEERLLFGQRVREVRRTRGLSQEQLAERAEIATNYLSSIERGLENPTFDMLVRLARALKVDLVDLFNYSWLKMTEAELRRKIRTLADRADLERLREMLALMKAREA